MRCAGDCRIQPQKYRNDLQVKATANEIEDRFAEKHLRCRSCDVSNGGLHCGSVRTRSGELDGDHHDRYDVDAEQRRIDCERSFTS